MTEVSEWAALQCLVGAVPRASTGYTTNFFASREQFDAWSRRGPVQTIAVEGALLMLRADRDFHRVYHVAADPSALAGVLNRLPSGIYATDLVGRGASVEQICAVYGQAGFQHHSFLIRMTRKCAAAALAEHDVELAIAEDISGVSAFLERLLDPYTEQVPDAEELSQAAQGSRLMIVRRETGIAGMLMYDTRGQLAHLRYWHVDHDARGVGVGRLLMESFLARCAQMRQITLWVIGDNHPSIAIYRHYGFAPDGMIDQIMILHKEA